MADRVKFDVKALDAALAANVVVLVGTVPEAGEGPAVIEADAWRAAARAAAIETFKPKAKKTLTVLAPGEGIDRLILVGTQADDTPLDPVSLGGVIAGKASAGQPLSILIDNETLAGEAAAIALGFRLRTYAFDAYKTKKGEDDDNGKGGKSGSYNVTLHVPDPAAVKKALKKAEAIAAGVETARTLVNEPPNVLVPVEFADRAASLSKLGVEIEVLDEKQMKKLGMRALLGVGQGSRNESRVVVMRWNGGKPGDAPAVIIGKGVTFDTGGISIKPAAGMEDMKGDMAGAACVVGLMQALAGRKAKANVIGLIGLVENMPDGNAQRPGDIVTSMSGQTIEIINTDAEGRLVLADVLWYANERFKPAFMINLATLTGAILIALGKEYAGLFSNDDRLSADLSAAGEATGEKVWRLPLGPAYDKLIDSKFADMKNTGGRNAGSITAAQFLKRFVGDTPWAHLDIAGTGMDSPSTDISKGWASGWGVRLLDRLIAERFEH